MGAIWIGVTLSAGKGFGMSSITWLPLAVSIVAALIAGAALWRTHFSRGRLIWAASTASLSVTGWLNSGKRWFTPDLAVPVSVANIGARPVVVRGMRVRLSFPNLPIPKAQEIWELNHELDLETELEPGKERTALSAIRGTGTPFIVLPKTTVDKRFLFWCRWEKPVVQRIDFHLEVCTSRRRKWRSVERWEFEMTPQGWVYLAQEGGRVGIVASSQLPAVFRNESVPEDLHKYTGPTGELPKDSGQWEPSYVTGKGIEDGGTQTG